jgi:glycine betaine/proline transport system substrate-binding protein
MAGAEQNKPWETSMSKITTRARRANRLGLFPILAGLALAVGTTAQAGEFQKGEARFGGPTWPGATMKSEVAMQVLNALGYDTSYKQVSYTVAVNGVASKDLDVYVAGWKPAHYNVIQPLIDKGEVEDLVANVSNAKFGMAVPSYAYEAGVKTLSDLDAHAQKFGSEIYGIDSGSEFNTVAKKAVKNDHAGLGDWSVVESSTSGMLSQVKRKIRNEEWVAFNAWSPHWMNAAFDIDYVAFIVDGNLRGIDEIDGSEAGNSIHTIVPTGLAEHDGNLYRFLKQYKINAAIQSQWLYEYGFKDQPKEEVARTWIKANLERVIGWVEGVHALDGKPASDAVKAAFGK